MRLRSVSYGILQIDDWNIQSEEAWCILGGNASGKSQLATVLSEDVQFEGQIDEPLKRCASVSLESLQAEYERELANDDTDFLDRIDYGSTGLEILLESGTSVKAATSIAQQFHIEHLLDRGCRQFSSGEIRRIYLLREVLAKPDFLILDEPFEGLDKEGRAACSKLIESLISSGLQILLLVNRLNDVASWVTHLGLLKNGKLLVSGTRNSVLESPACIQLFNIQHTSHPIPEKPDNQRTSLPDPLIKMTQCCVTYNGTAQFKDFDWTLNSGEHTLVSGANGSGKSTLLNLITGDHPQCYSNDLQILGYKRGSGESIWEIKSLLGIVSPSLHRDYRAGGTLQTVVLSGFYDSIGLYCQPTTAEIKIAREWLSLFGMNELAEISFRSVSFGQQRLALIARALVKRPPLLILDEPTQGLDDVNRHLVLAYLEKLTELKSTTLLFVSHREDEHLPLFKKRLTFTPDTSKTALYRIFHS